MRWWAGSPLIKRKSGPRSSAWLSFELKLFLSFVASRRTLLIACNFYQEWNNFMKKIVSVNHRRMSTESHYLNRSCYIFHNIASVIFFLEIQMMIYQGNHLSEWWVNAYFPPRIDFSKISIDNPYSVPRVPHQFHSEWCYSCFWYTMDLKFNLYPFKV